MTFSAHDHQFMARALQLAELGLFTSTPNPRVGCVIVQNGKIIGEGAHLKAGSAHAEIFALQQAAGHTNGATAYVTLEPCNHTGRTPPCAQALINAGIAKVIIAMQDPNPLVSGSGIAFLQANGITVQTGLMQAQAELLNPGFISRMTHNKPFVRCKIAASLDGKTALNNDQSQWITSEQARLDVQYWRARSCAILTGIGTVLADDPSMTVRDIAIDRQPLRVIVDSQLQISPDAKILKNGYALIAFNCDHEHGDACKKTQKLLAAGAQLIKLPNQAGNVCLKSLLSHLAGLQINEVLVEAGETLNGALLSEHLIDELLIYYAPKLMGGAAKNLFALPEITSMSQAITLDIKEIRQIGVDLRLRAKPIYAIDCVKLMT